MSNYVGLCHLVLDTDWLNRIALPSSDHVIDSTTRVPTVGA